MNYSDDDLTVAVERGHFTLEQIQAFRHFIAQSRNISAADEESFRLVTSFNDIFVLIASSLFLSGLVWAGESMGLGDGVAPFFVALASWGLAEVFTRKRRMALPSIFLLLSFVGAVYMLVIAIFSGFMSSENFIVDMIAAAITMMAAWLHWRRFCVPITVAAGVAALLALVFALLGTQVENVVQYGSVWASFGLIVLVIAIAVDSRDPKRQTHYADIAFWLHLLAAPLLVHPVFSNIITPNASYGFFDMVVVLGLYTILTLISLLLDRRGLMVAAMGYVIWIAMQFLRGTEIAADANTLAIIGLILGGTLLLLSAFWYRTRQFALQIVPQALRAHLPA